MWNSPHFHQIISGSGSARDPWNLSLSREPAHISTSLGQNQCDQWCIINGRCRISSPVNIFSVIDICNTENRMPGVGTCTATTGFMEFHWPCRQQPDRRDTPRSNMTRTDVVMVRTWKPAVFSSSWEPTLQVLQFIFSHNTSNLLVVRCLSGRITKHEHSEVIKLDSAQTNWPENRCALSQILTWIKLDEIVCCRSGW